jgi:GMP synthase-like glutamine amidotransferase
MKPFAYLNNWHIEQPATRFDRAIRDSGLPLVEFRTNVGEFPNTSEFSGVFVGASVAGAYDQEAWVARAHDSVRQLAHAQVPMLGLCFGSQLLASALMGHDQVFKRGSRNTGYSEVEFTEAAKCDPLTKDFPERVRTFHWHGDEIKADHPDMLILKWKHGPVWGIQPHPEMDRTQICQFLEKNRDWFLSEGKDVDALIAGAEENEQLGVIFDRFMKLVRENQAQART